MLKYGIRRRTERQPIIGARPAQLNGCRRNSMRAKIYPTIRSNFLQLYRSPIVPGHLRSNIASDISRSPLTGAEFRRLPDGSFFKSASAVRWRGDSPAFLCSAKKGRLPWSLGRVLIRRPGCCSIEGLKIQIHTCPWRRATNDREARAEDRSDLAIIRARRRLC